MLTNIQAHSSEFCIQIAKPRNLLSAFFLLKCWMVSSLFHPATWKCHPQSHYKVLHATSKEHAPPTSEPKCALEAWHICSQPHPMNRESGLFPHMDNLLIKPSVTPDSAMWPHLPLVYLSIPALSFPFCVLCPLSYCISNRCPPVSQLSPNSCHASVLKQVFVTPLLYHWWWPMYSVSKRLVE